MGLQVYLNIHQVEDLVFTDLAALNQELMQGYGGFGELYSEFVDDEPDFEGPFRYNGGVLQIAERSDSDFEGYNSYTSVWGCFSDKIAEQIAAGISSGKLVLHLDTEGNPDEYFVLTPGKMEKKAPSGIQF